jgi:hypothetical protein
MVQGDEGTIGAAGRQKEGKMNTEPHRDGQLSAYLDGALAPDEGRAVEGHVSSCAGCQGRLGELRATAALIGSLPDPMPSRRLVPRVAAPPAWLAPLRTLTTLASGASVFLFIATALLANMGSFATGTAGAPAAARSAAGAGDATASSESGRTALSVPGSPVPGGNVAGNATAAPTALSQADSAKAATTATPVPPTTRFSDTSSAPKDAAARSEEVAQLASRGGSYLPPTPLGTNPLLWLGLAILTGAIAIALQRRLRSA